MIYSRDTPFWLETLDCYVTRTSLLTHCSLDWEGLLGHCAAGCTISAHMYPSCVSDCDPAQSVGSIGWWCQPVSSCLLLRLVSWIPAQSVGSIRWQRQSVSSCLRLLLVSWIPAQSVGSITWWCQPVSSCLLLRLVSWIPAQSVGSIRW